MNYVCDDGKKNFTVYRAPYCVDDMCFPLEKDEIHVSDWQFFLPNYQAKREIVHIWEKFAGTDTQTKQSVTFYFKNEAMDFYRGNTLETSCFAAYE